MTKRKQVSLTNCWVFPPQMLRGVALLILQLQYSTSSAQGAREALWCEVRASQSFKRTVQWKQFSKWWVLAVGETYGHSYWCFPGVGWWHFPKPSSDIGDGPGNAPATVSHLCGPGSGGSPTTPGKPVCMGSQVHGRQGWWVCNLTSLKPEAWRALPGLPRPWCNYVRAESLLNFSIIKTFSNMSWQHKWELNSMGPCKKKNKEKER